MANLTTLQTKAFKLSLDDVWVSGMTDRQVFEAAIEAAHATALTVITVPNIGRNYALGSGYLQYGTKRINWEIDAKVGMPSAERVKLFAPVVHDRGAHMPGFGNRFDACLQSFSIGPGALSNLDPGISAHSDEFHQAWNHERGRAVYYHNIGTGGQVNLNAVSFTANSVTFATAFDTNTMRLDMYVDVVGTTNYVNSNSARFSSRLTGWSEDKRTLYVTGWKRHDPSVPEGGAIAGTPTGTGRKVVVNPNNKVWSGNINVFLNAQDSAFGYTSASILEIGLLNATDSDYKNHFNRDTTPPHFYGLDFAHLGDATQRGGGHILTARGVHQKWYQVVTVMAAERGLHMEDTVMNAGGVAVETSTGDTTGPDFLGLVRRSFAGVYDRLIQISAKLPRITLGRTGADSSPQLYFRTTGGGQEYDSAIFGVSGTGTTGTPGQGTLAISGMLRYGVFVADTSKAGFVGYFKQQTSNGTVYRVYVAADA